MIHKLDKNDRINYIIFVMITILYVFRGILAFYNIDKIIYIISALSLIFYIFQSIKNKVFIKNDIISKEVLIYFFIILLTFIFSLIVNFGDIITTIAGFLSSYLNFFVAFFFLINIDNSKRKFIISKYLKTLIILGTISGFLGIYQTFIDPSILGFANNDIYGNPELLATGNYTIRATAMLGSAQNYGLFVGSTFALAFFTKNKTKYDYLSLIILLIGILVSGSRSASICVIVAILIYFLIKFKDQKTNIFKNIKIRKKTLIISITGIIITLIASITIIFNFFNIKTVKRLINFDITPALEIYKDSLSTLEVKDFILGKGLGYRDWAVNQLIGAEHYKESFNEPYKSSESFFMLSFLQSGIIRIIAVFSLIVISIFKIFKRKEYDVLILLLCIFINQIFTPSFTGMAMSFIYYPVIVYPFLKNNITIRKQENKYE